MNNRNINTAVLPEGNGVIDSVVYAELDSQFYDSIVAPLARVEADLDLKTAAMAQYASGLQSLGKEVPSSSELLKSKSNSSSGIAERQATFVRIAKKVRDAKIAAGDLPLQLTRSMVGTRTECRELYEKAIASSHAGNPKAAEELMLKSDNLSRDCSAIFSVYCKAVRRAIDAAAYSIANYRFHEYAQRDRFMFEGVEYVVEKDADTHCPDGSEAFPLSGIPSSTVEATYRAWREGINESFQYLVDQRPDLRTPHKAKFVYATDFETLVYSRTDYTPTGHVAAVHYVDYNLNGAIEEQTVRAKIKHAQSNAQSGTPDAFAGKGDFLRF